MITKTLDECKIKIEDKCDQVDIVFEGIKCLFTMACKFVAVVNGFLYLALVIICLLHIIPWWSWIVAIGLFFIEMVGAEYARSNIYDKRYLDAKLNICENYLVGCEEYCKLAEWQQKQIFRNDISKVAGIVLKEDNNQ